MDTKEFRAQSAQMFMAALIANPEVVAPPGEAEEVFAEAAVGYAIALERELAKRALETKPETATSWAHVIESVIESTLQDAVDNDEDLSPQAIAQAVINGAIASGCTTPKALQEAIGNA